jgi:hypothetical protein
VQVGKVISYVVTYTVKPFPRAMYIFAVLHTEELLNIKYLNFKSALNSITGKQTISYKWITECKSRFNSVCSKKIRALSEAMKARKNTLNFYIHFIFKYYTSDFVKLTLFINSCVTILTKDIQLE